MKRPLLLPFVMAGLTACGTPVSNSVGTGDPDASTVADGAAQDVASVTDAPTAPGDSGAAGYSEPLCPMRYTGA